MTHVLCKKMNRAHHVKGNKPDSEKQTPHIFSDIQNLYTKQKRHACKGRPFEKHLWECKWRESMDMKKKHGHNTVYTLRKMSYETHFLCN